MKLKRPLCEFRGAPPHPADPAYLVIWNTGMGPLMKWSCWEHRLLFGGRGYWVTRVEGYEDNGWETVTYS